MAQACTLAPEAAKIALAAEEWAATGSTPGEAGTDEGILKDIKACVALAILQGKGPPK